MLVRRSEEQLLRWAGWARRNGGRARCTHAHICKLLEVLDRIALGACPGGHAAQAATLPSDTCSNTTCCSPFSLPLLAPPAASELPHFTVLERESKVLGCAAMKPLGRNAEGDEVAELGAFVVHASVRGGGKGDSLLEYLGARARRARRARRPPGWLARSLQRASGPGMQGVSGCSTRLQPPRQRGPAPRLPRTRAHSAAHSSGCTLVRAPPTRPLFAPAAEADAAQQGIQRLVLLTTRTADWFEQRGFKPAGAAHLSALLPEGRRARVDPARNSQLYSKRLRSK